MEGIIIIIIVIAVLSAIPGGKSSPPSRRRNRHRSDKPYGLPWMGGSMKEKKKDYFSD
ncbi:hypothetical protein [Duncaniella muris]|jgi:hypothetical protein|uniref:hypothetical protein n=1 Tax=Duncaniella muris TaxID=2094150 RepID=UPI003F733DDF